MILEIFFSIADHVYKYLRRLAQFVAALFPRKKFSIELLPKIVSISDFLSIVYNKPLR